MRNDCMITQGEARKTSVSDSRRNSIHWSGPEIEKTLSLGLTPSSNQIALEAVFPHFEEITKQVQQPKVREKVAMERRIPQTDRNH